MVGFLIIIRFETNRNSKSAELVFFIFKCSSFSTIIFVDTHIKIECLFKNDVFKAFLHNPHKHFYPISNLKTLYVIYLHSKYYSQINILISNPLHRKS